MFFQIFANIFWRWIENTLVKLKIHFVWSSVLWGTRHFVSPSVRPTRAESCLFFQHLWVCMCVSIFVLVCVVRAFLCLYNLARLSLSVAFFFFLLCFTWLINIDPDWMMESLRKLKWACEPGGEPGRVRMRILTDAIVWILRAQVLKFAWQLLNQIKSNEYLG